MLVLQGAQAHKVLLALPVPPVLLAPIQRFLVLPVLLARLVRKVLPVRKAPLALLVLLAQLGHKVNGPK
jgi:hypothetical protein